MPLIFHIVTTGDQFSLFCCTACLFVLFFQAARKTFFFLCRSFTTLIFFFLWVFLLFSYQNLLLWLDRYISLCSLEHTVLHICVGTDYNTCLQVLVTHCILEYLLQAMCVFWLILTNSEGNSAVDYIHTSMDNIVPLPVIYPTAFFSPPPEDTFTDSHGGKQDLMH